jgi:hypothetical protein
MNRDFQFAFPEHRWHLVDEMPATAYAERANGWLTNPDSMKKTDRFCIGCHE